jgi:hypothetical protein
MGPSRGVGAVVLWLSLLFLLGVAVTAAVFCVFIPGPERGMTFYAAFSLVVTVEFVFFAHLAQAKLARVRGSAVSDPVRYQVQGAIVLWFIATVVIAALALDPKRADTLVADRILVIDLVLAFAFFSAAYFLYAKSGEVGRAKRELAAARSGIQQWAPELQLLMSAVAELGHRWPEHAVDADRTAKRVDAVRAAVEGVLVSERSLGGDAQEVENSVQERLSALAALARPLAEASADQTPQLLAGVRRQADEAMTAMQKRERAIVS